MKLLALLLMLLPQAPAAPKRPVPVLKLPHISCETLFRSPAHARQVYSYFVEAAKASQTAVPAGLSGATWDAQRLLGIRPGRAYELSFRQIDRAWGEFLITITSGGEIVYMQDVRMPALRVWKPMEPRGRGDALSEVDVTLAKENLRQLEVGLVYENMGTMRKYVSIRSAGHYLDTVVTVGIDIRCDSASVYTGDVERQIVVIPNERLLCRIPLISAAFPYVGDEF